MLNSRRLLGFICCLFVSALLLGSPKAAQAKYASIVIDVNTGEVLHAVNADTRNHPASLTKIMTLYMLFDALEKGKVKLDSSFKVSRKASRQRPSKLGLRQGSRISVENAILALVTKSANDVAVVVAEGLGKTEAKFAAKMTSKAHEMGMKNTFFKNASGLHNKGQLSSARDMAILGQRIRTDFPQYYQYFSTWKFKYSGNTYYNHNKLLRYYDGTDGIKTGFTNPSGFNLVASVERNGRRLLGVVFGGKTSKSRNRHMVSLLDNGFHKLMIASIRAPLRPEVQIAENGSVIILGDKAAPQTALALNEEDAASLSSAYVQSENQQVAQIETAAASALPSSPAVTNPDASSITEVAAIEESQAERSEAIWAVQVGAFHEKRRAQQAAGLAAVHIRYISQETDIQIQETFIEDRKLYRARLAGLGESEARDSCELLEKNHLGCVVIAPETPGQIATK